MTSASGRELADWQLAALDTLVRDLRTIFGSRLHALVAYGLGAPDGDGGDDNLVRTLALVEHVTFDDLALALPYPAQWHRRRLGVPLILSRHEFARSLDVFPLEYGNIIASHVVIVGENPFGGTRVAEADRRRACEQQAKSHVIHLREGFLETDGDPRQLVQLIARSAPSFGALLVNLARLEGGDRPEAEPALHLERDELAAAIERSVGIPAALIVEVLSARADMSTVADPTALLARYIDASERIWRYVDGWRA